ncbi:hypothetical protein [Streptomyces hiroshimensis]|nr:hypothetical protein [Streptomyces hiroshimensis]
MARLRTLASHHHGDARYDALLDELKAGSPERAQPPSQRTRHITHGT